MSQLSFLSEDGAISEQARPLAHRNDPVTSRIAARAMAESGALSSQQARVLEALREFPGTTSDELAQRSGLDRYLVARRLPDLARLGHAVQDGRRESSISRRQAVVWRPLGGAAATHPRQE
jgi:DNA-binding MarR family transcriptional regulator